MRTGRLPFEVFLGLRYLRARGHRANLSLFVWIGIGGVFLGVSALIVVLAVMTGFQDGIRDRIIAANPHVLIMEAGGRGVANGSSLAERVAPIPGVVSASPFVLQQALFTSPGGGATGGLLRGVDTASPAIRDALAAQVRFGSLKALLEGKEPALLLGRELARSLGVVPGDHVTVISPQGAMTAVGLVPKMRRFLVAGYVEIGMYEYDVSLAYTTLTAAQEFAGLGDRVTGVEVKLADAERIRESLATLQGQLEREHQDVASAREELMARLGALPASAAPIRPVERPREPLPVASPPRPRSVEPASPAAPAADEAAEQMKKLRRDAKRRAMGGA